MDIDFLNPLGWPIMPLAVSRSPHTKVTNKEYAPNLIHHKRYKETGVSMQEEKEKLDALHLRISDIMVHL